MGRERAPKSAITLDYRPLATAVEEFCACRGGNYHDVATLAEVPFPKVLHLMAGDDAQFAGHHVVNLARVTGLPLSELVRIEGGE